jgi:hypothetical protein
MEDGGNRFFTTDYYQRGYAIYQALKTPALRSADEMTLLPSRPIERQCGCFYKKWSQEMQVSVSSPLFSLLTACLRHSYGMV